MAHLEKREISPERKLALTANGMFVRVSRLYPDNFIAQGADLALTCKTDGHNPIVLKDALQKSSDLVLALTKIADEAHAKRGPGSPVTEKKMIQVIGDDFVFASRVMHLEDPDIRKFLNTRFKDAFIFNAERLMTGTPIASEEIERMMLRRMFRI